MQFISEQLEAYCSVNSSPEDHVLSSLNRETHLKVLSPRMLSGHLQGNFLSLISKIHRPQRILEIGTYTGYSAICLARGLEKNGKLITIDVNAETEAIARKYFKEAKLENEIELIIGDAKEIIPQLNEIFDLIFIDADKKNYANYYDLIIEKVKPGGIIIADNVLWSGKVLMEDNKKDADTKAINDFNNKIQNDARVENLLLPLRDGLMMMRKL